MILTLLEARRPIKNGIRENGDIGGYEVDGLPAGEFAQIAFHNHAWRFLRWNSEWHGNWTGSYPTALAALKSLRDELLDC